MMSYNRFIELQLKITLLSKEVITETVNGEPKKSLPNIAYKA